MAKKVIDRFKKRYPGIFQAGDVTEQYLQKQNALKDAFKDDDEADYISRPKQSDPMRKINKAGNALVNNAKKPVTKKSVTKSADYLHRPAETEKPAAPQQTGSIDLTRPEDPYTQATSEFEEFLDNYGTTKNLDDTFLRPQATADNPDPETFLESAERRNNREPFHVDVTRPDGSKDTQYMYPVKTLEQYEDEYAERVYQDWQKEIKKISPDELARRLGDMDKAIEIQRQKARERMESEGLTPSEERDIDDITAPTQEEVQDLVKRSKVTQQDFKTLNTMLVARDQYADALRTVQKGLEGTSDTDDRTFGQKYMDNLKHYINPIAAAAKTIYDAGKDDVAEFTISLGEGLTKGRTWDMGYGDLRNSTAILNAARKADAGEQLTQEEDMILESAATRMMADSVFQDYVKNATKFGEGTATSIAFMIQTMLTAGSGIGAKAASKIAPVLARKMIQRYGIQAAKKGVPHALYKAGIGGAILAGDVAGGAIRSLQMSPMMAAANATERMTGTIIPEYDKETDRIGYAGRIGSEDETSAWINGSVDAWAENWSELVGEYFAPITKLAGKGVHALAKSLNIDNALDFMHKFSPTKHTKLLDDYFKRAQYQGLVAEFGEEKINDVIGLLTGSTTFDDKEGTGIFNAERNWETFGTLAPLCGFMSAARAGTFRSRTYVLQSELDDMGKSLQNSLRTETWDRLKEMVDLYANNPKVLTAELRQFKSKASEDGTLTQEQMQQALAYAAKAMELKGAQLAEQKKARAGGELQAKELAYDEGRTAEGKEMQQAKEDYEYTRQALATRLGLSTADIEARTDRETGKFDTTGLDVKGGILSSYILDYETSNAKYEGVKDKLKQAADSAQKEAEDRVYAITNKQTGKVQPAMISIADNASTTGLADKQVYIVVGNVVTRPDGTIDKENSDQDIYVVDPAEGNKATCISIDKVTALGTAEEAQAVMQQAGYSARMQTLQEEAKSVDGELTVGSEWTIQDQDGSEHTYKVEGQNEDGTVNYSVDGVMMSVPAQMSVLQEMYDQVMDDRFAERIAVNQQAKAEQEERERQKAAYEAKVAQYQQLLNFVEGDELMLADAEGNTRTATVNNVDDAGNVKITFDRPVNGVAETTMPLSKLQSLAVSKNGQVIETYSPLRKTTTFVENGGEADAPGNESNASTSSNETFDYETARPAEVITNLVDRFGGSLDAAMEFLDNHVNKIRTKLEELNAQQIDSDDLDESLAQAVDLENRKNKVRAQLNHFNKVLELGEQMQQQQTADLRVNAARNLFEMALKDNAGDLDAIIAENKQKAKDLRAKAKDETLSRRERQDAGNQAEVFTRVANLAEGRKDSIKFKIEEASDSMYADNQVPANQIDENIVPKAEVQAIEEIAKRFGLNIVWLKHSRHFNGKRSGNNIYLALDNYLYGNSIAKIFGHEMTHWIKAHNMKAYRSLIEATGRYWETLNPGKSFLDFINEKAKEYAGIYGGENLAEQAIEEATADAVGETIATNNYLPEIVKLLDTPKQSVIKRALKRMVDLLHGIVNPYYKTLTNALDAVEQAYVNTLIEQEEYNRQQAEMMNKNGQTANGVVMSEIASDLKDQTGYKTPLEQDLEDYMRGIVDQQLSQRTIPKQLSSGDYRDLIVKSLTGHMERLAADDLLQDYLSKNNGPARPGKANSPIRQQGDIYGVSFDLDTTCPRTLEYLTLSKEIESRLNRPLHFKECIQLIEMMRALGFQIPCVYCYAENKRQALKEAMFTFMKARTGVFNAKSKDEALKRMYGHAKKTDYRVLTDAATKVFNRWWRNHNNDIYLPTIEQLTGEWKQVRSFLLRKMDEMASNGAFSYTNATKTIAAKVMKELGLERTDADTKREVTKSFEGQVESLAAEWRYDGMEKKLHDDLVETGEISKDHIKEVASLWGEMTNYAKSSSQAKKVEMYAPYTNHLKLLSKAQKKHANAIDGLRMHSTNDFRIDYITDYFQLIADMDGNGWKAQTYTKNPDFVRIFGRTGIRINMSLAAYGGENGTPIVPDVEEGFDWEEAKKLREQYPNAGIMMMVTNQAQLEFALNADWIDMVIPFHASSLPKVIWKNMRAWYDFSSTQNEKFYTKKEMKEALKADGVDVTTISKDDIEDTYLKHFNKKVTLVKEKGVWKRALPHFLPGAIKLKGGNTLPGHENNIERYLQLCKEYAAHPRFEGIKVHEKDGREVDITQHSGYLKVVREVARLDVPENEQFVKFNINEIDPNLPVITEQNVETVLGPTATDNLKKKSIGKHMSPIQYAEYLLRSTATLQEEKFKDNDYRTRKTVYDDMINYQKVNEEHNMFADAAQYFIDTYIDTGVDLPLSYLDPLSRAMFGIFRPKVMQLYGAIPYHEKDNDSFSLRTKADPEKTKTGYAVFVVKQDKEGKTTLHPKMIVDGEAGAPVHTWLDADTGSVALDQYGNVRLNKYGRAAVSRTGNTQAKDTLAWRPGKHLAEYPNASQFVKKNGQIPANVVFFEVEYAADKDYQLDAWKYGINKRTGKYVHTQAGLPFIPADGYYKYRTNSGEGVPAMIIAGAYKINRALTDEEAEKLNQEAGGVWYPRENGPITESRLQELSLDNEGLNRLEESYDYSKIDPHVDDSYLVRDLPGYDISNVKINFDDPALLSAIADNDQDVEYYRDLAQQGEKQYSLRKLDQPYMDAVKRKDMTTAADLVKQAAMIAMPNTLVVDEDGNPKVMFHGSDTKPNIFRMEPGMMGTGAYFTSVFEEAADYAREALDDDELDDDDIDDGDYITEAYLNITDENDIWHSGYGTGEINAVVRTPAQIKSAETIVYDDNGEIIPLSDRFNMQNEDVRYSVRFYSPAIHAVEGIKQDKATGEQWLKMLEKAGGLKKEEDKWIGLSDFLEGKKSVTKDEVLNYIRDNELQIEDVWYLDPKDYTNKEVGNLLEDAYGLDFRDEFSDGYSLEDYVEVVVLDPIPAIELYKKHAKNPKPIELDEDGYLDEEDEHELQQWAQGVVDTVLRKINEVRMGYTTAGLDNQREIALVVPTIEPYEQSDLVHFGDAGDGRAVAWSRFGETTDKDGNTVLVIDEIQSKRHQDGREKGYSNPKAEETFVAYKKTLQEKYPQGYANPSVSKEDLQRILRYYPETAELTDEEKATYTRLQNALGAKNGVPDAPFRKNWYELAMKRMLLLAAENGYDKLAWTTGQQQAERYGIGGVVESIYNAGENTEGLTDIDINLKADPGNIIIHLQVNKDGLVVNEYTDEGDVEKSEYKGKNLSDLIGKSLTQKVLELEEGEEIAGEGLRVGGEGMKGFYDQMLPRFMDKYCKKWGTKTSKVELPGLEKGAQEMWSVDITPAMKESVTQGQPMFSIRVYHGTGADFDKFDHSFMGSGEGAQAYGWGTYVTEVKGIGKIYAKKIGGEDEEVVFYNGKNVLYDRRFEELLKKIDDYNNTDPNKLIEGLIDETTEQIKTFRNRIDEIEAKFDEYKKLYHLIAGMTPGEKENIWQNEEVKKSIDRINKMGDDETVIKDFVYDCLDHTSEDILKEKEERKEYEADHYRKNEAYRRKVLDFYRSLDPAKLEIKIFLGSRILYSVDIPDDDGSNYLDYDSKLTEEEKERINEKLPVVEQNVINWRQEVESLIEGVKEQFDYGVFDFTVDLSERDIEAVHDGKSYMDFARNDVTLADFEPKDAEEFVNEIRYDEGLTEEEEEGYDDGSVTAEEIFENHQDYVDSRIRDVENEFYQRLVNTADVNYRDNIKPYEGPSLDEVETGSDLIEELSQKLTPKEASEFLSSIGYTGVKYPAGYRSGGRKDGKLNYVIFNADDAKIVDKQRFSLRNPAQAYLESQQTEADKQKYAEEMADEFRADWHQQYAIVDLEHIGLLPEYFEKKVLAETQKNWYNKLGWGDYRLVELSDGTDDPGTGKYEGSQYSLRESLLHFDELKDRITNNVKNRSSLTDDELDTTLQLLGYWNSLAHKGWRWLNDEQIAENTEIYKLKEESLPELADEFIKRGREVGVGGNVLYFRTKFGTQISFHLGSKGDKKEREWVKDLPKIENWDGVLNAFAYGKDDTKEYKERANLYKEAKEVVNNNLLQFLKQAAKDYYDRYEERRKRWGGDKELTEDQKQALFADNDQYKDYQSVINDVFGKYGSIMVKGEVGKKMEALMPEGIEWDSYNTDIKPTYRKPYRYTPEGYVPYQERLAEAIKGMDLNPTEAQKKAGNYKKGHINVDGLDITIENPKGSTRTGKDKDGKEWSTTMQDTYGYIKGTTGKDGDQVDVYLSDDPEYGNVYVVDQINQDDERFDEHKVMYGYPSEQAAREAYKRNYEEGWKVGVITEVSRGVFKEWLKDPYRTSHTFHNYDEERRENERRTKYSLRGIKGAAYDQQALGNLAIAEIMERQGKDSKTIWQATGWERGADGEWRNEIPDLKAKPLGSLRKTYDIEDVLDAPELFKSYPELKQYKVKFVKLKGNTVGSFSHSDKLVTMDVEYNLDYDLTEDQMRMIRQDLHDWLMDHNYTESKYNSKANQLKRKYGKPKLSEYGLGTFIHELQHAVQDIEGFAKGGSPVEEKYDYIRNFSSSPEDALFINGYAAHDTEKALLQLRTPIIELLRLQASTPGNEGFPLLSLADKLENMSSQEYAQYVKDSKKFVSKAKREGEKIYNNLAGEVEARNAEKRFNMTDDERRETPPSETEDVKRSDQVVHKPTGQVSPAYSLRADNYTKMLDEWKRDNNLPKDAKRPLPPTRKDGESPVQFAKRLKKYNEDAAMWRTAPTFEGHLLYGSKALDYYNLELQRKSVLNRIAAQDSMLAVKKGQEAIAREIGVPHIGYYEDVYAAENRSHGKAKNMWEEYHRIFLDPLAESYHDMKELMDNSYDKVANYLRAKHGLERNVFVALRSAATEEYSEEVDKITDYYKNEYNKIKYDQKYDGDEMKRQELLHDVIQYRDGELAKVKTAHERIEEFLYDPTMREANRQYKDNEMTVAEWLIIADKVAESHAKNYHSYRYDEDGTPKDYSGLSALFGFNFEKAAIDYVQSVDQDPKKSEVAKKLWNNINEATKKTLHDTMRAGMMTHDNYAYIRSMFQFYIPLRGWNGDTADDVWNYVEGGKGAMKSVLKAMHGRTDIADDPIAYIQNMAESAILINNKNIVKQYLYRLALNHPSDLLTISKAWYVKSVNEQGKTVWKSASPAIPVTEKDPLVIQRMLDDFETKMKELQILGEASQKRANLEIEYPTEGNEKKEHEVHVMIEGEEFIIYVNGDPQLAQAINGTRSRSVAEGAKSWEEAFGKGSRWLASVYTSLSPKFVSSNYFRDWSMVMAITAVNENADYNKKLWKNIFEFYNPISQSWRSAIGAANSVIDVKVGNKTGEELGNNIFRLYWRYQHGKLNLSNPMDKMFYDFLMEGGETGFVTSLQIDDFKKKFRRQLLNMDRSVIDPRVWGPALMDLIEFVNRCIEGMNRFLIYKTSIEMGRPKETAIDNAKNVTLNFNRKGTGEAMSEGLAKYLPTGGSVGLFGLHLNMAGVRSWYLFVNPAIQAMQTVFAAAKNNPMKFTATAATFMLIGAAMPYMNQLLVDILGGAGDGDDDDYYYELSKWDRRNNLMIYIGDGKFLKIPLSQEFRTFYGMGDIASSMIYPSEKAKQTPAQYALDGMGAVMDLLPLDPTGYDGNLVLALSPNVVRWPEELYFNVDFTGKPIFKDSQYNQYDPNWTKAYAGTPDYLVRISKFNNSILNPFPDAQQNFIDKALPARINPNNPAVFDHMMKSVLGGTWTFVSQIVGMGTKAIAGDDLATADIPVHNWFVTNPADRPAKNRQGANFYDQKSEYDRLKNTLKNLRKAAKETNDFSDIYKFYESDEYQRLKELEPMIKKAEEEKKQEKLREEGNEDLIIKDSTGRKADEVYQDYRSGKDIAEDMELQSLYNKIKQVNVVYERLLDMVDQSKAEEFYKQHKTEIDAWDDIENAHESVSFNKSDFTDEVSKSENSAYMEDLRQDRQQALQLLRKIYPKKEAPQRKK